MLYLLPHKIVIVATDSATASNFIVSIHSQLAIYISYGPQVQQGYTPIAVCEIGHVNTSTVEERNPNTSKLLIDPSGMES